MVVGNLIKFWRQQPGLFKKASLTGYSSSILESWGEQNVQPTPDVFCRRRERLKSTDPGIAPADLLD